MNTSLLNIVKQIIAANGEGILSDPARVRAFFSDLLPAHRKEPLVVHFFQFQILASHCKKLFHGKGRPHPFGNTPQIFKRGITAGNRLGALRGGKRKNCPARRYFTGNLNGQPVVCRDVYCLFNHHGESIP